MSYLKKGLIFCSVFFVLFSCTNQKEKKEDEKSIYSKEDTRENIEEYFIDYEDPKDYFTLDFSPQKPQKKKQKKPFLKKRITRPQGKNIIVQPQMRKLEDYEIEYSSKKQDTEYHADNSAIDMKNMEDIGYFDIDQLIEKNHQEDEQKQNIATSNKKNVPFVVADWGPKEQIPSEVRFPSFYVLFSSPVKPFGTLQNQTDASTYMTVTPSLKGSFKWHGTSLLSFEAKEAANPLTKYKIAVSSVTKDIYGSCIQGPLEFFTQAAPLKLEWAQAGTKEEPISLLDDLPQEAAKNITLGFNYAIDAKQIKSLCKITVNKAEYEDFLVTQEKIDAVNIHFQKDLPKNAKGKITIELQDHSLKKEDKNITVEFGTLKPFSFVKCNQEGSYSKYSPPVYLTFCHPIDEKTVLSALQIEPKMDITQDNIRVFGDTVMLFGLPVAQKTKYKIKIATSMLDVWGQPLEKQKIIDVQVPNMTGDVRFFESGTKILEAQFSHKLIFEYQNISPSSCYLIEKTNAPFLPNDWKKSQAFLEKLRNFQTKKEKDMSSKDLPSIIQPQTEPKDTRLVEEVDLDPYLENGLGSVCFGAVLKVKKNPTKWDKDTFWTANNLTTVQVTNLGVTARIGANRILAIVSSLQTAKPIENATVNVFAYNALHEIGKQSPIATGKTDKNGLCKIELSKQQFLSLAQASNKRSEYYSSVIIEAIFENDRVLFTPESHSPWGFGVFSQSFSSAFKKEPRIFLFCDRGLYRPGEKVLFKGIDRDQRLGGFSSYQGDYKIELQDSDYENKTIYAQVKDKTSCNGSFYGSFDLPKDLPPGLYSIVYERSGATKRIDVNVAYFQNLKFQCSVEMPKETIIAGDDIKAKVKGSYLAGGNLLGAEVQAKWFKEPCQFSPQKQSLKEYRFSPLDTQENRLFVSSCKTTILNEGEGQVQCKTLQDNMKGVPYRYRLSSDVVDISGQSISCVGNCIVHPASFYLGVKKESKDVFFKIGQKVSFSFIQVTLEEDIISSPKDARLLFGEKIQVTLLRDEWTLAKQQGVAGYIYDRYKKTQVEEQSFSLPISFAGTFEVTPQKAGNHVVKISSRDEKGRDVIAEYSFYATGGDDFVCCDFSYGEQMKLTTDRMQYSPGDVATILLESPIPQGDYLVTTEREGIFTQEVKHFDTNVSTFQIKIALQYLPVVYVCVSSYSKRTKQPSHQYGEVDLDRPKGVYGFVPIFVDTNVKAFSVDIQTKTTYKAGEDVNVTLLATKNGKPVSQAELTLLAVDRSVLDLMDYHIPNPIDFFYDKNNFPSKCAGGDSRAYLMNPVTYSYTNLSGGDSGEDEKMQGLQETKDFNPIAAFFPSLVTDEYGRVECKFHLPDNLSAYRLSCFGIKDDLFSLDETEIIVNDLVTVQSILPEKLRERDTCQIGVLLSNLDEKDHIMSVSLSFENQIRQDSQDSIEKKEQNQAGLAKVDGKSTQTLTVPKGSNAVVYFDVAALFKGQVQAVFLIESDVARQRLICPIEIQKPLIYEAVTTTRQMNEDVAKENISFLDFLKDKEGFFSLTLDSSCMKNIENAMQYVFDYPYFCTEQQTAKLLPLVLFPNFIEDFKKTIIKTQEPKGKTKSVKEYVKNGFGELAKSQLGNGSFSYWQKSNAGDMFMSARVAHLAFFALKNGYAKKDLVFDIDSLVSYMKENVSSSILSCREKAYTYYVLCCLEKNYFERDYFVSKDVLLSLCNEKEADLDTICLCGLCAFTLGNIDFANELAQKMKSYMRPTTTGIDLTLRVKTKNALSNSKQETLAWALKLLLSLQTLQKDDTMIDRLLFTLLQEQNAKGYWSNTQTTFCVLDSLFDFMQKKDLSKTKLEVKATLKDEVILQGKFLGAASPPLQKILSFQEASKTFAKEKNIPLIISKKGNGNLFYSLTAKYSIPLEMQKAKEEGLFVDCSIFDAQTMQEMKSQNGNIMHLENGKIYEAVITLSSTYDRNFIALRSFIPSGSDILDATFATSSIEATNASGQGKYSKDVDYFTQDYFGSSHYMSNQVIYENEIQSFWDSFQKGVTTFDFKFRTTQKGIFPTPPVQAECMYSPEIFGRTSGYLFVID